MALNANVLGDLMKASIDALSDGDKQDRQKVFRALATAVVAHIQASALVVVTTPGATAGPTSLLGTGAIF